jgi:hypothetical protein
MQTKVSQSQRPADTRCVFCHDDFLADEELSCQCGALYHPDCFQFYGCGTIGCAGSVKTKAQLDQAATAYAQAMATFTEATATVASSRITRKSFALKAITGLWLLGGTIIALLAILCFAFHTFHKSILALALLSSGSFFSYVIGFIFLYLTKKHAKQTTKDIT